MKKTFSILEAIFFVLAAALFTAPFLVYMLYIGAYSSAYIETQFANPLMLVSTYLGILLAGGLIAFFVGKRITTLSAYIIFAVLSVYSFAIFNYAPDKILYLLPVVFYGLAVIFRVLVLVLKSKDDKLDPKNDKRINLLKEWKDLLDKGFITAEEYEDKRAELLNIKK
jgi:hypothetical protein